MIVTAYAHMEDKLRLLFALFDFDASAAINMDELIFFAINLTVGWGRFTNTIMPPMSIVRKKLEKLCREAGYKPEL